MAKKPEATEAKKPAAAAKPVVAAEVKKPGAAAKPVVVAEVKKPAVEKKAAAAPKPHSAKPGSNPFLQQHPGKPGRTASGVTVGSRRNPR
jgi:hypothetical protein